MDGFMRALVSVWTDSGFAALTWQNMVIVFAVLIFPRFRHSVDSHRGSDQRQEEIRIRLL